MLELDPVARLYSNFLCYVAWSAERRDLHWVQYTYNSNFCFRTYVIFDAEENRPPPFPRSPYLQDVNR